MVNVEVGLFKDISRALVSKAGYSGIKRRQDNTFFLPPVQGSTGLFSRSTQLVMDDPFPQLLQYLGIDHNQYVDERAAFMSSLKDMGVKLLPIEDQQKMYRCSIVASLLVNGRVDLQDLRHSCQTGHLDFSGDAIDKMIDIGIFPFVFLQPLSDEGSFVRVHPQLDASVKDSCVGEMVYLPHGTVLGIPGSLVHGEGYQTGPHGNPCLCYVVFLIKESVSDVDQKSVIPVDFSQTYIGAAGAEVVPQFEIKGDVTNNLFDCPQVLSFAGLLGF